MARLVRHPMRRDVALAGAVAAVMLVELAVEEKSHGYGVLPVLAVLAASAPLALRTRYPLAVVVASALTIFPVLEACGIHQAIALPPMISLYTYARATDRRRSILAGLGFVPVVLVAVAIYNPAGVVPVDTAKNLALIALPVLAGNAVRDRRAYLVALHERLEIAERTREEEALRRVGEERLRLARDVHDVVAHSMVAINVQARVANHLMDRRPDSARESLTQIASVSGEAIRDLRATLGVLRDESESAPVRPAQGLAEVDGLVERVRAAGVELEVERHGSERPLPSAVDVAAYRIVQEALTNVLRHAQASRAELRLDVVEGALEIQVVDDGNGATAASRGAANGDGNLPPGSGNGVRGMRERAAAIGGVVEAGALERGGWRVRARLPLPSA